MAYINSWIMFTFYIWILGVAFISNVIQTASVSYNHTTGTEAGLVASINTDGAYSLAVNGITWLRSAPTFFRAGNETFSAGDGSLKLVQTTVSSGQDEIGRWQATRFEYTCTTTSSKQTHLTTTIKVYYDIALIRFSQVYNDGEVGTQASTVDHVIGGFPGFSVEGDAGNLGYLSYGGGQSGDEKKHIGQWYSGTANINYGIEGGPLAIFDRQGRTLIISPFNHFMSASFWHDRDVGGNFYGGIMGGVSEVPANYTQEFLVFYAKGINKAFDGWGDLLRAYYRKDVKKQHDDDTIKYLGYWTDNGAYYYYNTIANKTYEETVLDVKTYADTKGIPYRYMQFDSWWYYKGIGGGVKTWEARPDVFPDGFSHVAKSLNLPTACHNRYWASDTTYAKQNGGKYDFIVEKTKALPLRQVFWRDLFAGARNWSMILYEQDWLSTEFASLDALLRNLTLGTTWLAQMDAAAAEANIHIQYCMSNPRHVMQALELPSVTQIRASHDYHPGRDNWKIGISSMFISAMGVAPYKDTFWTTEHQPGNPYGATEPNWEVNTAVSVFSTGPVGPGDGIGYTNTTVLKKCCNAAGLILKPEHPARALDAQIIKRAFPGPGGPDGEVWISYTDISGLRFATILALDLNGTSYTIYPQDTGLFDNATDGNMFFVPYDQPLGWGGWTTFGGLTFDGSVGPSSISIYHVSMAFPNMFQTLIFGELDKWVPMSPQRVKAIRYTNASVEADLYGVRGESFDFWFIQITKLGSITCTMPANGKMTFVLSNAKGYVDCIPRKNSTLNQDILFSD